MAVNTDGYLTEAEFCDLMVRGFLDRPAALRGVPCHPEDVASAFSAYVEAAADGMGLMIWRVRQQERNR